MMRNNGLPDTLTGTTEHPLGLRFTKAEGPYLYDEEGNAWLDMIAGIGVNNLGHCHPKVIAAIKEQADHYLHQMVYGEFHQSPQVKLSRTLTDLLPPSLDSVYFTNSGAEANEAALKLAKRYTGRTELVAFQGGYHGSTHGALSVSWGEHRKQAFRPLLPDVRFLAYNDVAALEGITERTAGVIMEPVQGDAGVRIPDQRFMSALKARCNEKGALLILDEIQTGIGRTGEHFAFEHFDCTPDILTSAKALGGGMPLGALIAPKDVLSHFTFEPALGHITTFGGHPVSCAAALAGIEALTEEVDMEAVKEKGAGLAQRLEKHPAVKEVRYIGLMLAVELKDADAVQRMVQRAIDRKLLLFWFLSSPTAFRIAPPLNIDPNTLDQAGKLLMACLDELQGS